MTKLEYASKNSGQSSGGGNSQGSKNQLPDWLKERFDAGNKFNKENRSRYPYNEVEVYGNKKICG